MIQIEFKKTKLGLTEVRYRDEKICTIRPEHKDILFTGVNTVSLDELKLICNEAEYIFQMETV